MKTIGCETSSAAGPHPRVLVLLAAYNGAPWIAEQIDSILDQQEIGVHVAIRDDGSTNACWIASRATSG